MAAPLFARSGHTTVQMELHKSTAPYALDANMQNSTTAGMTANVKTSTAPAEVKGSTATASPDGSQVDKINLWIHELKSKDSAAWPAAAANIHALNPGLEIPPSILKRLVRLAYVPADREKTRGGYITTCVVQGRALDALAAFGSQAHSQIPLLVRLTHRVCIHEHVVQALDQIGSPDSDQLTQIAAGLDDKDPEARQAAVEYLGAGESTPEVVRILGRALNDPNSGVRLSALQALEKAHPEGGGRLPLLAPFLKDPSPEIRERAIYMIGEIGADSRAAVPLLHEALHDGDPLIALQSAKYLAKIDPQDDELLTTLIAFTKKKNSDAAAQAASLLQSLNIHEARIDNALAPYRSQESLRERINESGAGLTPEQLAENARTLKVDRVRVASRIVQDLPVGVAKVFPAGVGRVYCWTAVSVSTPPASVSYRWYRDGKLAHEDELALSTSSQGLWSTSIVRPGHWKVDISPAGVKEPIATAVFTVSKHQ